MSNEDNINVFIRLRDRTEDYTGVKTIEDFYNYKKISLTPPIIDIPYVILTYLDPMHSDLFRLKDLFDLFSGKIVDVRRLFKINDLKEIYELRKKQDPSYNHPKFFFKYFIVECNNLNSANLIEEYIEGSLEDIIERVYFPVLDNPPTIDQCHQDSPIAYGYLEPSPVGVGAESFCSNPTYNGDSVQLVDIEGGWDLAHLDIQQPQSVTNNSALNSDHGTSVIGIIARNNNIQKGGIVPICKYHLYGHKNNIYGQLNPAENLSTYIALAAAKLSKGDVLLIECQVRSLKKRGPKAFEDMPCETIKDVYETIKEITDPNKNGVIVIEPAGNDGKCLDEFKDYAMSKKGKYIFDKNQLYSSVDFRDSGAIMIGASFPRESGTTVTHPYLGGNSNWGFRVDCFAWGDLVCTCDKTDSAAGDWDPYRKFGGTSSASAIIAGVVVLIQDYAKKKNPPVTYMPLDMRDIISEKPVSAVVGQPPLRVDARVNVAGLRVDPNNGTAYGCTGRYIGVMPCLKKLLTYNLI